MESSCLAHHILRFTERLRQEDVNMHGYLISVSGREIAKAYWFPFREGLPHRLYSVSKTFTGIAVGDAPCGFDMLLSLRDGLVTVRSRCSSDPLTAGFDGIASGILQKGVPD